MPRIVGENQAAINYRHIIDSLVRKPGAFANYQYREEMSPTPAKKFDIASQLTDQLKELRLPTIRDQIFKDTMTTAAAIDRLVHHSVIVELNVTSFRVETAKKTKTPQPGYGIDTKSKREF